MAKIMRAKIFFTSWLGLQSLLYIATAQADSPPTANAGKDLIGVINRTITLDGSASSDPDGDSITYLWTIVSAPENNAATLTAGDTAKPSIIPTIEGTYTFSLQVSDGDLSSSDQVSVYVKVPTNVGVLLDGNPDSPAVDSVEFRVGEPVEDAAIVDGFITNRLYVVFNLETATVESLNAALESVGARMTTSLKGLPMMDIAIPPVSSVHEAELIVQKLLDTGLFYYAAPLFYADPTASVESKSVNEQ
jgi:hypothetical protein